MSNVLELVNIRKSFGAELVLNDLSLTVPEHTATVLIGASGSGKSTLLRCINLLESIDDGQIFLDGKEISDPLINVDLLCIDPQTEPDYGDAKNWATQVSGRRHEQTMRALFSEELGVVIQIERSQRDVVFAVLRECGISAFSHVIGKPNQSDVLEIWRDAKCVYTESRLHLQKLWQNTSYQIARLRDNPNCVDSEYQSVEDVSDPLPHIKRFQGRSL